MTQSEVLSGGIGNEKITFFSKETLDQIGFQA
jgi:hypothetical protein